VTKILAKSLLQSDGVLDIAKDKIAEDEAEHIVMLEQLKHNDNEIIHLREKVDKLDHEVNTKDNELSHVETYLFQCLQRQLRETTHAPTSNPMQFGKVEFPRSILDF
jgi:chromosome segregation ATPase